MDDSARHQEIGAGFDRSAERYDREIGTNPAMAYMRQVSLAELTRVFGPGQHVLEIGCGTGEESIALARHGVRVFATDLSQQMVSITQRKVTALGLRSAIQARQLAAGQLSRLLDEFGEGAFDGAYSSFGPLNGEPDLYAVSGALASLLCSGSSLVVSVMSRFCLFETLWYLAHGQLGQAARRWRGSMLAPISPSLAETVPTWYHTPHAFARQFAPEFQWQRCRSLPLFLPPPFVADLWSRYPGVVRRLRSWEESLSWRWPFCAWGDHFLLVLQRK